MRRLRLSAAFAAALVALATDAAVAATGVPVPVPAPVPVPVPVPVPAPALPLPSPSSAPSSSPSPKADAPATAAKPQVRQRTFRVAVATGAARAYAAEVNRVRRRFGLRAVRVSALLARAATEHAKALATSGAFTHAWTNGGVPFSTWIRRFYPVGRSGRWSTGENLVWRETTLSARDAVQMWLASPPHRRNLLSPIWREIGLGVVQAQAAPGMYGGADVQIAAAEFGVRR